VREIDRYPRATLRDRLEELVGSAGTHPGRTAVLAVIVLLIGVSMLNGPRPARLEALVVGDCLYARTAASTAIGAGGRPIGEPLEVEAIIAAGGAEYAACDSSHGHEVASIVDVAEVVAAAASRGALRAAVQSSCDAAFVGYVGRSADGSELETFVVLPTESQLDGGASSAVCLVARRDGQWLSAPARGSGR
jgi:hypothetical protein